MILPTQTRDQFIDAAVTAAQASGDSPITFDIGSIGLALLEGDIQNWLTVQAQIVILSAAIRLATCQSNADVNSFIADFGLQRLAATPAQGNLTFARFTPTALAVVPVGTQCSTETGVLFQVSLDPSNPYYNATAGGYVLNPAVTNISIPAEAVTLGEAGNAAENTINLINVALPNVDTVNNPAAFTGGQNTETNAEVKKRFPLFFASLSRATGEALEYAIVSTDDTVKYLLVENIDYTTGATSYGQFFAVLDDGSGTASSNTLAIIYAALDRYRAFCVRPAVYSAVAVPVTITATITVISGADGAALATQVEQAITDFISNPSNITVGSTLYYNRLAGIIYDVSSDITIVSSILLNSGTSDIAATYKQSIVLSSVTITVAP